MTEELLIEVVEVLTKELGGKLSHYTCIDRKTERKQIVIDYAEQKRQTHTS